jgi:hypothetical protein
MWCRRATHRSPVTRHWVRALGDGKPVISQPIAGPLTTYVKVLKPFEYNHGLRKPSGRFPTTSSASSTRDRIAEAVGAAALAPSSK